LRLGEKPKVVFLLRRMRNLWPWLYALLSGILLALAFPPADLGGLAWFALVPLIWALWFSTPWKKFEPARLFLLGYVAGVGYFLGCLQWLVTVTVAGWIALCLFLAIYPAIWALFVGLVAKPRETDAERPIWLRSGPNLLAAILIGAAWVATEWLRGVVFSGFGWNGLGIALHDNIALIQIADITGVGGVSFMLVMVNAMIVLTIKRLRLEIGHHKLRPHYDFSLTVAIVALAFGYGVRQLFAPARPSEPLTIAAVQANIPVMEKRDPEQEERILTLHRELTERAIALKPDLLIWPEAATPQPLFNNQHNWDVVKALAEKHDGDFLTGTVYFATPTEVYNSAVLLSDKAAKYQVYHKIHLVPFGEYVPLRSTFPLFAWIVGDLVPDDFDFGREPTVLQMSSKPVKLAALICFEDTLGDLARRFVKRGAQLFVTVTNDGWFLQSAGSVQHLRQAIFRCVETKVPMVRAANTGVTCTIDSFGRIQKTLTDEKNNTFMEGFLVAQVAVPKTAPQTFYTKYGEIFSLACLTVSVAACGAGFLRRRR